MGNQENDIATHSRGQCMHTLRAACDHKHHISSFGKISANRHVSAKETKGIGHHADTVRTMATAPLSTRADRCRIDSDAGNSTSAETQPGRMRSGHDGRPYMNVKARRRSGGCMRTRRPACAHTLGHTHQDRRSKIQALQPDVGGGGGGGGLAKGGSRNKRRGGTRHDVAVTAGT